MTKRKIIIPLLSEYYLFDYMYDLANECDRSGLHVTFYVVGKDFGSKVEELCPNADVQYLPYLIKGLSKSLGKNHI